MRAKVLFGVAMCAACLAPTQLSLAQSGGFVVQEDDGTRTVPAEDQTVQPAQAPASAGTPPSPAQPAYVVRTHIPDDPDIPGVRIPLEILGGLFGYAASFGLSYFFGWAATGGYERTSLSEGDYFRVVAGFAQVIAIPVGAAVTNLFGEMAGSMSNYYSSISGAAGADSWRGYYGLRF